MKRIPVFVVLALYLGVSESADFEEERELTLDAAGIESLSIDAGNGDLIVNGVANSDQINVKATVWLPQGNAEKAQTKMNNDMELSLIRSGSEAKLVGEFRYRFWALNREKIDLELQVPEGLNLAITDGTGHIQIEKARGNITVRDGTGHIWLSDVGGDVEIADGTGAINVDGVGNDIRIDDGTGEIDIQNVMGSVFVVDGAGHINVENVDKDLEIISDGVGGISYENIRGSIRN